MEDTVATKAKKRHRPSVAIGLWIIKRVERLIEYYSEVGNDPVLDNGNFPWVTDLEANWQTVRQELQAILEDHDRLPNFQEISRDQVNITRDDKWKTFFLHGYGYRMDKNCERCPETARLVEAIPGMFTAFFSVLSPGKHIPPHRGPYKGLLRCHLALMVPEPREQCRIRVHDQIMTWEEGRCLVFDDTCKHEVWNDTEGTRVVLFLDILRPLRFPGSWINRLVIALIRLSPYIQDARRNHKAWEEGFDR